MDVPALPRCEDDLVEWSVYADERMRAGDPIGEIIAFDLALPASPDTKQLADFQRMTKKACWRRRKTTDAAWALGQVRELVVKPFDRTEIDGATLANVTALLATPIAANLEHLQIATWWRPEVQGGLRRLFDALPASCTRLTATVPYHTEPLDLVPIVELLPDQLEEISFLSPVTNVGAVIDDRFAVVEVDVRVHRESIERRLARTSRVVVRTGVLEAGWHPRIVVRDGAGVIEPRVRTATALARPSLFTHQEHVGIVPIRAQLERSVPEHYHLAVADHRVQLGTYGNTLRRTSGTWTLRTHAGLRVDGADVTDRVVELADGAVLDGANGARAIFYTRDLATHAKRM